MHKKIEKKLLWYDRERFPYKADYRISQAYAEWVRMVPWKLFGTFTFAGKPSDPLADKTFAHFIDRLEALLNCDVAYVRGDEKRFATNL